MKIIILFLFALSAMSANNELFFVQNVGQKQNDILYYAELNDINIFIKNDGIYFDFYQLEKNDNNQLNKVGHLVKLDFINGNKLSSFDNLSIGKMNFFIGNDKSNWKKNVNVYNKILINEVFEGVDFKLYFENNTPRYDFIIHKNANPENIKFKFNTVTDLTIQNKSFSGKISVGDFFNDNLFAYQLIDGQEKEVKCNFKKIGNDILAFDIGKYNKNTDLVIDPIIYNSYLGWGGKESGRAIQNIDANSYIVAGTTESMEFPVSEGAYQEFVIESQNIFIAEYKREGIFHKFIRGTYLGGSESDLVAKMEIDANKNIYLCGTTSSSDFPVAGIINQVYGGKLDGFVAKLDDEMTELTYSYYVGGSEDDEILDFAIAGGKVYFCGYSKSLNLKVKNAVQDSWRGASDGILGRSNAEGNNLDYLTYYGGSGEDMINGIDLNPIEDIIWIGSSKSFDFTVNPSGQKTQGDNYDIVMGIFRNDLSENILSTFVGGTENDYGVDVKHVSGQEFYFLGYSYKESSKTIPTVADSYQEFNAGGSDILFGLQKGPNTMNVTFIGGSKDDIPHSFHHFAPNGDFLIFGETLSNNFPVVTNENQPQQHKGKNDGFICIANKDFKTLNYTSYIGGKEDDIIYSGDILSNGSYRYIGTTTSNDMTLIGKANNSKSNGGAAFVGIVNNGSMSMQNPNGGFDYCQKLVVPIIFDYNSLDENNLVDIYLSNDSLGTFDLIVKDFNEKRYEWTISSSIVPDKNYKIVVAHKSGVFIESFSKFGIKPSPKIESFSVGEGNLASCVGDKIAFVVEYTDATSPSFIWKKNDKDIIKNKSNTYTIESIKKDDAGVYTVAVEGDCNPNALSDEIMLTVTELTDILSKSNDVDLNEGSKLEISVETVGGELKYQWYLNANILAGKTNKTLLINSISKADEGNYTCEVEGKCGDKVTSEPIKVTLKTTSVNNNKEFTSIIANSIKVEVEYNAISNSNSIINIIDLNGKTVTNFEQYIHEGRNKIDIPINLENGMYILNIIEKDKTSSIKFIVIE